MPSEEAASIIFKVFGMAGPDIKPTASHSEGRHSNYLAIDGSVQSMPSGVSKAIYVSAFANLIKSNKGNNSTYFFSLQII